MDEPRKNGPNEPAPGQKTGQRGRRGAHLPAIASQGGRAVVEKYGSSHMSAIGRRGAQSVVEKVPAPSSSPRSGPAIRASRSAAAPMARAPNSRNPGSRIQWPAASNHAWGEPGRIGSGFRSGSRSVARDRKENCHAKDAAVDGAGAGVVRGGMDRGAGIGCRRAKKTNYELDAAEMDRTQEVVIGRVRAMNEKG